MSEAHGDMADWIKEVTAEDIASVRATLETADHAMTDDEIRLHIARSKINPRRIARMEAET